MKTFANSVRVSIFFRVPLDFVSTPCGKDRPGKPDGNEKVSFQKRRIGMKEQDRRIRLETANPDDHSNSAPWCVMHAF
jgi:hypothetical protein